MSIGFWTIYLGAAQLHRPDQSVMAVIAEMRGFVARMRVDGV